MSATIPPNGPGNPTTGFVDWIDLEHNVREIDLEWIQNRSVVRFNDATARTDYSTDGARVEGSLAEGQLTYLLDSHKLQVNTGGDGWRTALLSNQLNVVETGSGVSGVAEFSNNGADGLGIGADGAVRVGKLRVGSPTNVGLSSAGISIKTGAKTVILSTNDTQLVSNSPLKVTDLEVTGTLDAATLQLSGATSVTTLTASGAITSATSVAAPIINAASGKVILSTSGIAVTGAVSVSTTLGVIGNATFGGDVVLSTGRLTLDAMTLNGSQLRYHLPSQSLQRYVGGATPWQRASGIQFRYAAETSPTEFAPQEVNGARSFDGALPTDAQMEANLLQVRAGTVVGTVSASGGFWIHWPAFNSAVISVLVSNGNSFAGAALSDSHKFLILGTDEVAKNKCFVSVHQPDGFGVIPGQEVRVNFIALGW